MIYRVIYVRETRARARVSFVTSRTGEPSIINLWMNG